MEGLQLDSVTKTAIDNICSLPSHSTQSYQSVNQNMTKNKTVLYHCHDLGSTLAAQVMRKCTCFCPWMQMVLEV